MPPCASDMSRVLRDEAADGLTLLPLVVDREDAGVDEDARAPAHPRAAPGP